MAPILSSRSSGSPGARPVNLNSTQTALVVVAVVLFFILLWGGLCFCAIRRKRRNRRDNITPQAVSLAEMQYPYPINPPRQMLWDEDEQYLRHGPANGPPQPQYEVDDPYVYGEEEAPMMSPLPAWHPHQPPGYIARPEQKSPETAYTREISYQGR
jgi:hypothetical protein